MKTALLAFLLVTLPASGPISMSQIQTEFARGGANPISMSEYYKPGTYVLAGDTNPNGIPASGAMTMHDFHGAAGVFSLSASANGVFGDCLSPSPPLSCTASTSTSTCSGVGGTAPYTYAFSYVSGTTATAVGTGNTRYFTRSGLTSVACLNYTGAYRCTVTDAALATATASVNVSTTHCRE